MPAQFLEEKVAIPFLEYMAILEKTNLKGLLKYAAMKKSEQKISDLLNDYSKKVNCDKELLKDVNSLPYISENPKTIEKVVVPEQEIFEKQPLILRDSVFSKVIKASFDSFLNSVLVLTNPSQYQELLNMINKDLEKQSGEEFDISTKENLMLGLANRYAKNAEDAWANRSWKAYNFYMRSLAYFVPILIERVNSKQLEKKAQEMQEDFKVLSKMEKLVKSPNKVESQLTYQQLVDEIDEKVQMAKNSLDRINNRFRYRMIQNVSYPLDKAEKIGNDIWHSLNDIEKKISSLWGKIG